MGNPGAVEKFQQESKTCPKCGVEFFKSDSVKNGHWKQRKYCSRSCRDSTPNSRKLTLVSDDFKRCVGCDTKIYKSDHEYNWSRIEYCSEKCRKVNEADIQNRMLQDKITKAVARVGPAAALVSTTRSCPSCGKEFEVYAYETKQFCSEDCSLFYQKNRRHPSDNEHDSTVSYFYKDHDLPKTKRDKDNLPPLKLDCLVTQDDSLGTKDISNVTVGAICELVAAVDMLFLGHSVFRALSANCVCDLIAVIGGKPFRVEVKKLPRWKAEKKDIIYYFSPDDASRFDILALVDQADVYYSEPVLVGSSLQAARIGRRVLREDGTYYDVDVA